MHCAYLSLGSNLHNPAKQVQRAITLLQANVGSVVAVASFYLTEPWGFCSAHRFVNTAVLVHTLCSPQELLRLTQEIEQTMGRKEKTQNATYQDRVIDIDLLMFDNLSGTFLCPDGQTLQLPHPRISQRLFVLMPMADIAPQLVHPVEKQTFANLLSQYVAAHPEEAAEIEKQVTSDLPKEV